jgi:hypothetical protein
MPLPPLPKPIEQLKDEDQKDAPATCPKCQSRLLIPESLGYCTSCGYCRSLDKATEPAPANETSRAGLAGAVKAVAQVPGWLSIMLGGMFAVLLYCKALDFLLANDTEARAIWGTGLLVAGIVVLILSHFWTIVKIAPEDAGLGISDALIPSGTVWAAALKQLPITRWPIWLAGWSMAIIFSSVAVIGGQLYWLHIQH